MSCGCNTYRDDGIEGMDETDFLLMGAAGGGYLATAFIDNKLVYDKDGKKKTGAIAENDNMRNLGYVASGAILTAFMPGDDEYSKIGKGLGVGMAVFGVKELFRSQYPTYGIKGMRTTGDQKYIASQRTTGDQKYIGKSSSSRLSLNLEDRKNAVNKESVVIKNVRA